jgi:hypothetical protein
MTTSTPSFLVGVEVTSERESAVCDSTTLGIFPQWETMAGGSSREGLPGFSRLVPKLLFPLVPPSLCPIWKPTRATLLCPAPRI